MGKQKKAKPQKSATHQWNKQTRPVQVPPAVAPVRQAISIPFTVYGPFDTPIKREGNGTISFPLRNAAALFAQSAAKEYADDIGCYVLARRIGESFTPFYVGQTTKGFAREVFNSYNREGCYLAARKFPRGKMVLFLLIPEDGHGTGQKVAIDELEKHLVARAYSCNKRLLNERLLPSESFEIAGVTNAAPGKPLKEVQQFKRMLGYETKNTHSRKK